MLSSRIATGVRMLTTSTMAGHKLIAVCQMTSSHNIEENYATMKDMIKRAAYRNCKMVFFPECSDFVGRTRQESVDQAIFMDGDFVKRLQRDAAEHGIWISVGSIHEQVDEECLPHTAPVKVCMPKNSNLVIDAKGDLVGKYRKLHLFDLDIPGKVRLMESEFSSAGHHLVKPIETPVGRLGMCICYDVRFPELSLWYRKQGAQILSYPAAFTVSTGLAHWETLLRTRAIETQCYVVAAAQTGMHNEKRSSYGHSMIVDPWGAVVAQCSDEVDMCFAEIKLDYLEKIRLTQPVFAHRRNDLYSLNSNYVANPGESDIMFGEHVISKDTIFYRSELSYAFVNHKPVVEGHVLVAPINKVERLTDLTDEETADLFIVAKRVQKMLEKAHKTNSSTVAVQDGPCAGQTVKHVHVHIVPRTEGDFKGDDIYEELSKHDKKEREPRPHQHMKEEAELYAKYMLY
uniref:Nitrilase and fragile histidine triad fusion protein NitFhit n=1 Tax=Steinernema glaseri TaxID=37863 RepID=A0A1I8AMZ5_9BILA